MTRTLLREAMRQALTGAYVVAAVTALVIAPALTLIGMIITFFLLISIYPVFLLASCAVIGWQTGKWMAESLNSPRWRATVLVGGGTALMLTVVLLATALALTLLLTAWLAIVGAVANGPSLADSYPLGLISGAIFTALYLAIAPTLGFPCACLGAWLALRSRLRSEFVTPRELV